MELDPQVKALAMAIRDTETGNRAIPGGSGELASRYQYMPGTWKSAAKEHLGNENAPLTLENENYVTYQRIKGWKDQGYNPAQIASLWNSGSPDPTGKVGVNKAGVAYNTPAYVQKVYNNYQKYKTGDATIKIASADTPATSAVSTGKLTSTDFAKKIKAKYPQYANIDDATLTQKMLEKYPEYQSQLSDYKAPVVKDVQTQVKEQIQAKQPGIVSKLLQPTDIEQAKGVVGKTIATAGNIAKSFVKNVAGLVVYPVYTAPKAIYQAGKEAVGAVQDIRKGVSIKKLAEETLGALPSALYQTLTPEALQKGIAEGKTGGVGEGVYQAIKSVAEDPYQLLPYFLAAKQGIKGTKGEAVVDTAISKTKGAVKAGATQAVETVKTAYGALPEQLKYKGTGLNLELKQKLQTKAIDSIANNYREIAGQTKAMRKIIQRSGAQGKDPAQWLAERNIVPEVKEGKVNTLDPTGKTTYNFDSLSKPLYEQERIFLKAVEPSIPKPSFSSFEKEAVDYIRSTTKDSNLKNDLEAKVRAEMEGYRTDPSGIVEKDGKGNEVINFDNIMNIKEGKWGTVKFDATKPYQGDVNYAIGRAARKTIENSVPKEYGTVIKDINNELGKVYDARKFYTALDGRVVKGGKLGRYFSGLIGGSVGHGLPIPGGAVLGYIVGESIAEMLQSTAISDVTKASILKNIQVTQPEVYYRLIKYVGDIEIQRNLIPKLEAPKSIQLPEKSASSIQRDIESSGVVK